MNRLLVLIPVKPNMPERLKRRASELAAELPLHNPTLDLTIVFDGRGDGDVGVTEFHDRARRLAPLRQAMIEEHLSDHEAVLWIDADIVSYAPGLPTALIDRADGGIAAPMVLLEGQVDRLYDIAGFIEHDRWAALHRPWFKQPGPAYEMNGVGACYLVPAGVYRSGGRHAFVAGYTEHWSVCQHAKASGLPVRAFDDLRVYHAWLPDWGEPAH